MQELSPEYTVEVDTVDRGSWYSTLRRFADANIYQTWSYEAVRSGERNLSHLLLKRSGDIVAAAQVRLTRMPYLNVGVAYVRWGPMWRLQGTDEDEKIFAQALRALRNEYASRRRYFVRFLPCLFDDQAERFRAIIEREGFTRPTSETVQRTLLMRLDRSLEDMRKGLDQKWRNCLNRAEKNGLQIMEGQEDDLFTQFISIHRQMHERKKFVETSDVNEFQLVQRDLPESFKMKVLLAYSGGQPSGGVVCSCIGDMGVYLFGGTNNAGMSTKSSYLLQWEALKWLKAQGAKWYNLHGIDPVKNPGTFRFKEGFCGKNGKDVRFLGSYDACDHAATFTAVRLANAARLLVRSSRQYLRRLRR
jgi:lipid II:glycine glycyltransferase (peptidoglycan interpeptide bridge formation enzyme)